MFSFTSLFFLFFLSHFIRKAHRSEHIVSGALFRAAATHFSAGHAEFCQKAADSRISIICFIFVHNSFKVVPYAETIKGTNLPPSFVSFYLSFLSILISLSFQGKTLPHFVEAAPFLFLRAARRRGGASAGREVRFFKAAPKGDYAQSPGGECGGFCRWGFGLEKRKGIRYLGAKKRRPAPKTGRRFYEKALAARPCGWKQSARKTKNMDFILHGKYSKIILYPAGTNHPKQNRMA